FSRLATDYPGLVYVRFIDEKGNIHFSTYQADIKSKTQFSLIYNRIEDVEPDIPYDMLTVKETEKSKYYSDGEKKRVIYSFPFYDILGLYKGTALFYVSGKDLKNYLIKKSVLELGQDFSFFNHLGFIFRIDLDQVKNLKEEILKKWSQKEDFEKIQPLVSTETSEKYFLFTEYSADTGFIGFLIPENVFSLNKDLKIILMASFFITTYLLLFLILSLKQDKMLILSERIKRFQVSFLKEYVEKKEVIDWQKWKRELSLRKSEIKKNIKSGIGKFKEGKEKEIDSLIDKSWDDIISVIGSRIEEEKTKKLELPDKVEISNLEEIIERVLKSGQIVLPVAAGEGVLQGGATPNFRAIQETSIPAAAGTPVEVEELEEAEELEEIEAVEELEEVAEPETLEEIEAGGEEEAAEAVVETVAGTATVERMVEAVTGEEKAEPGREAVRLLAEEIEEADEITEESERQEAEELEEAEEKPEQVGIVEEDAEIPAEVEEIAPLEEAAAVEEFTEEIEKKEAVEVEEISEIEEIEEIEEAEEVKEEEEARIRPELVQVQMLRTEVEEKEEKITQEPAELEELEKFEVVPVLSPLKQEILEELQQVEETIPVDEVVLEKVSGGYNYYSVFYNNSPGKFSDFRKWKPEAEEDAGRLEEIEEGEYGPGTERITVSKEREEQGETLESISAASASEKIEVISLQEILSQLKELDETIEYADGVYKIKEEVFKSEPSPPDSVLKHLAESVISNKDLNVSPAGIDQLKISSVELPFTEDDQSDRMLKEVTHRETGYPSRGPSFTMDGFNYDDYLKKYPPGSLQMHKALLKLSKETDAIYAAILETKGEDLCTQFSVGMDELSEDSFTIRTGDELYKRYLGERSLCLVKDRNLVEGWLGKKLSENDKNYILGFAFIPVTYKSEKGYLFLGLKDVNTSVRKIIETLHQLYSS
ncbi:MAG: hypothetical protein AB1798_15225, partial [Spirochaetota bacterium]